MSRTPDTTPPPGTVASEDVRETLLDVAIEHAEIVLRRRASGDGAAHLHSKDLRRLIDAATQLAAKVAELAAERADWPRLQAAINRELSQLRSDFNDACRRADTAEQRVREAEAREGRLREALGDILLSGMEDIDERLSYVHVQVGRDDWQAAARALRDTATTASVRATKRGGGIFTLLLSLATTLTLATVPARAAQAIESWTMGGRTGAGFEPLSVGGKNAARVPLERGLTTTGVPVPDASPRYTIDAASAAHGRNGDEPEPAPADAPADDLGAWIQAAGWCPVRTRASGANSGEGDDPLGCDAGLALRLAPRLHFGHLTPIAAVGASSIGVGAAWLLTRRLGVGVAMVAPYSSSGGVRADEAALAIGATVSVTGAGGAQ